MANPRITVEINGDSSGLHKEMKKADAGVMGFASSLKSLAATLGLAFGAAQIVSFGRSLLKDAEYATTLAKELDVPLNKILALKKLGEETGIPFEKLSQMMMKAADAGSRLIEQGSGGSLAKKFEAAGLDAFAFASMDAADKLEYLVKNTKDADTAISLLNETLGRQAAVTARELFSGETQGLKKLAEQAGLTEEAYKRLTKAQDQLDRAGAAIRVESTTALGRAIEVYERAKQGTGDSTWGKIGAGAATTGIVIASWLDKLTGMSVAQDMLAKYPQTPVAPATPPAPIKENPLSVADEQMAGQAEYDAYHKQMAQDTEALEKLRLKNLEDAEKKAKRNRDIELNGAARRAEIMEQGQTAISGIQTQMPRLSGIESLGAVLGGTGGAARSSAERQAKLLEITNDTLKKIQESTKETAEALKE